MKAGTACGLAALGALLLAVPAAAQTALGPRTPAQATQADKPDGWQEKLRRSPIHGGASAPMFSSKDWNPPASPAPVAPAAIPAFPYRFTGILAEAGSPAVIYLSKGNRIYSVAAGDVLENRYRVEKIGKDFAEITYLPLNRLQTVAFADIVDMRGSENSGFAVGAAAPESTRQSAGIDNAAGRHDDAGYPDRGAAALPPIRGATVHTGAIAAAQEGATAQGTDGRLDAQPLSQNQSQSGSPYPPEPGGAMVILPPTLKAMPLLPPIADMQILPPPGEPMAVLPPSGDMPMRPPDGSEMAVTPAPRK